MRVARIALTTLFPLQLCAFVASCSDKGEAIEPVTDSTTSAADALSSVKQRGELAFGGETQGELKTRGEFHGYVVTAQSGAKATVEVTQRGSSAALDTTLYVYGPKRADGTYPRPRLAFDDDSGWGALSRISSLALKKSGQYLIVVGTFDGQGRGRYRLTATCAGASCRQQPPTDERCDARIAADIRNCTNSWLADPDNGAVSRIDVIDLCSDAEPVADAHDAACASAQKPAFCSQSYEQFATEYLPVCRSILKNEELDRTCLFGNVGETAPGIERELGLYVESMRSVRSQSEVSALSAAARAQIILVGKLRNSSVTTVADTLALCDGGAIELKNLWDATGRREFNWTQCKVSGVAIGALFAVDTTQVAAEVRGGRLSSCNVFRGPELRDCAGDSECKTGLRCVGRSENSPVGSCIATQAPQHPANTTECSLSPGNASCPHGSGLTCSGLTRGNTGLCFPAWMTRRYESRPALAIPDAQPAGATASLLAYGLATVDMDVTLEVSIRHSRPSQLRLVLVNPAGAEVLVYDGTAANSGTTLELNQPVIGFSGDESVNGFWQLRVTDKTSGQTGTIERFALTLGSRWD